mmetsp:Transcript_5764/g.21802  ORF Transcript_5764/g.21802 Transcript_5764/m.21802 type:complete len:276 (+) Transcript_5764:196-1023(+)
MADGCLVDWAQRKICTLHLPHFSWVEPHMWHIFSKCTNQIRRAWCLDGTLGETLIKILQLSVGESCANLAHRLKFLGLRIVYSQQIASVCPHSLSASHVTSNGYEIHTVSQTLNVILLHFEPIEGASRWFVGGIHIKRFDHETFAVSSDTLLEVFLDLCFVLCIFTLHKFEFLIHLLKAVKECLTTLSECLSQEGLTIEKEQVECEKAHRHGNVLHLYILAAASSENLKSLNALVDTIEGHHLTIQNRRLDTRFQSLWKHLNQIWIFERVSLQTS